MSDATRRTYNFIRAYTVQAGYSPTVREIVSGCAFSSTSVATFHLAELTRAGLIRRGKRCARNIEVVGLGQARADLDRAQAELEAWATVASKAGLREKIDFGQAFDILARIGAARAKLGEKK